MHDETSDFEKTVRRAFARLVGEDLPRAAAERAWPVRTREAFEALLLTHVCDCSDAAGKASLVDLVLAIELGERLLAGGICCTKLRRYTLTDGPDGRREEAWQALLSVLDEAGRARGGR